MPAEDKLPDHVEVITPYDRGHLPHYVRLLDAASENAPWNEAVEVIFGVDSTAEPESARRIYNENLRRARWMSEAGYAHLLELSKGQG